MSKNEIERSSAYASATLEERQRYIAALAAAGDLLPKDLTKFAPVGPNGQMVKVGDPGKVMLIAETGDMLGIHPMAALTGVHVIDGRPTISANLMGGLVRKAGHKLHVQTSGSIEDGTLEAKATLVRGDDPDYPFEVTWNVAKATRAGLLPGKDQSNWRKYPDAMMKARAISEVIREGAPDVLMGGNVYTPEELGAPVDEHGDPIEMHQVPDSKPAPTSARPAPAAERVETPIVDEPAQDAASATDWAKLASEAQSANDVRDLFRRAREEGQLATVVQWDTLEMPLGEMLTRLGTAMSNAESERAKREQEAAEATASEDVIVAELINESVDPDTGEITPDDDAGMLAEQRVLDNEAGN